MESDDRRRHERIEPFVLRCHVVDGARRVEGYLTNLSSGGGQVTTRGPAPSAEAAVVLELSLADRPVRLRLPARVAWVRRDPGEPGSFRFGARFEQVGAAEQEAIQAALGEFRRLVASLGPS
jgi:Tfp pilus assembly protein PilZ